MMVMTNENLPVPEPEQIVQALEDNLLVIKSMLTNLPPGIEKWRPEQNHWSLLEVVGHLVDEEVEDFRLRTISTLTEDSPVWPPIDTQKAIEAGIYLDSTVGKKLEQWLVERTLSIEQLRSLKDPDWSRIYLHPTLGVMTARQVLHNWLMHDYLHLRQIHRLKVLYFRAASGEDLDYAGKW